MSPHVLAVIDGEHRFALARDGRAVRVNYALGPYSHN